MGWSVRRWFQRRQRPVEPQGSGQVKVETPEVPTARTQFYERQAVAWEQAEAEFNSRTWPFLILGDVSQWARAWLPVGLVDASTAELEAAYVRGEIPHIPFAPSVELAEVVIAQAVEDGIVLLPVPGRLTSTYVHRDDVTERQIAKGYGLKVADSAVLEIRSAAGVIREGELGSSEGSPLHGAAAIERIVHQVIDTFAHVRPFLHYAWDKDHQPNRQLRQQ
ncbi:MAG: hypothetical protein K0Q61_1553 [Rhodococcus erythropolis]|nr:hypothetical protein [Rhodococcus erythropolis]